MERKFRIGLIVREMKRFWWLGVALLAVVALAIIVYSFAIYTPTYTVEAQEFVSVQYEPIGEDKTNFSPDAELAQVYKFVNAQEMKEELNRAVKKFCPDVKMPENNYALSFHDNIYTIAVTMPNRKDAEKIAEDYLDKVEKIFDEGTYDTENKKFKTARYQDPILASEVGLTPVKMCIFGFVGGVVVFAVVILCVFYFNRKLYNDQEFRDNFDALVLESDVRKNGYDNVCIKLAVQSAERDKPYVVALARKIDADALALKLMKEGFSVLKTDVQSALSANRELREENGIDVLYGTDGLLKSAEECKKDLAKNYCYDYILLAAADDRAQKSYITAADVADGTILGFDLKADDYRAIVGVFDELAVIKDLNLLGVVL